MLTKIPVMKNKKCLRDKGETATKLAVEVGKGTYCHWLENNQAVYLSNSRCGKLIQGKALHYILIKC